MKRGKIVLATIDEKIKQAIRKALDIRERKNKHEQYDVDANQQIRDMTQLAEREKGGQFNPKHDSTTQ